VTREFDLAMNDRNLDVLFIDERDPEELLALACSLPRSTILRIEEDVGGE
jgi:hypothetical protein